MNAHDQILDLKKRIASAVIGQDEVVDQLLIALLANGPVLMDGWRGWRSAHLVAAWDGLYKAVGGDTFLQTAA